ncbi:MAG: N-acetylneuraminate synthase family protein [Bacteroidia bacterium]|nr:N-acetylneuraminate synthase family protein [Bacteroidia bacterium]
MKLFEKIKDGVYVIAEIGGNFITFREAALLIDAAVASGVDCIKIQTFTAERICMSTAMFDMENTGKIRQRDYFKKYEISEDIHRKIFQYIAGKGVDYLSTPSHFTDVDMLERLNAPAHKIGADDATNIPLLKYVARTGKPVLLSTGMCTLEEVRAAVNAIKEEGNDQIVVFHTVSGYPTHPRNVNLEVIPALIREFPQHPVGFSDHTVTPLASLFAAAKGARVLERHFTLDKMADGPDHMLSSTPEEMKYLVDSLKLLPLMKGVDVKQPFGPEIMNRQNNRKSLVVIKPMNKGDFFSRENLDILRPGTGIPPVMFENVIGKRCSCELPADHLLTPSDIEQ